MPEQLMASYKRVMRSLIRVLTVSTGIFISAVGCGACSASAQPVIAGPVREWTVMIYMNGKNSLEPDALNNFHAIAGVGSTDRVAIVTQMGRPKNHFTTGEGGWSGVYRFYVTKGQRPLPTSAVAKVPSGVASDMGKQATLSNFIAWTKSAYPAQHYMVIVWNHGQGYRLLAPGLLSKGAKAKSLADKGPKPAAPTIGGFRAVSSDDDTGSILYNAEVATAVQTNFTKEKLDVLGFDACLMSMIETGYAFAPSTKLMVASEELEPGDGWQYSTWLDKLVAAPTMDGRALGGTVVQSYRNHYADNYQTTLSVLDLSLVPDAASALTKLSDAIRAGGPPEISNLLKARNELSSYADSEQPPQRLSIDLITLLERYQVHTADAALKAQAAQVNVALTAVVLSNYASSRSVGSPGDAFYGSRGIAVYFPATKGDFLGDYFHTGYLKTNTDRPIAFVQKERWPDLLYAALDVH